MEEAFKMRNLLEEFNEDHGVRPPTILGVREHIFTGRLDHHWFGSYNIFDGLYYNLHLTCYHIFLHCSVSSLAWFMSNQETSFVTIGQRVLARPLKYVSFLSEKKNEYLLIRYI